LIFAGAGAIVVTSFNPSLSAAPDASASAKLVLIALAHGLAIAVMASATGHISGGHFNPAVTFGALLAGQIRPRLAIIYWIAQLVGATIAAAILFGIFPSMAAGPTYLGTPALAVGLAPATGILVEAVLTFFLVFVVFGTGIDPKGSFHAVGGFAIGMTITMDILMGGPLTGAAMNPARWFGPAIVSGFFENGYVYWIGPLLGGSIAAFVYRYLYLEK